MNNKSSIEEFINRKAKAKDVFEINEIKRKVAFMFIRRYHYLGDASFLAKFSYGLYNNGTLVGVTSFTNPQGALSMQSWFGLDNTDQSVMELSRLCVIPELNGSNATSYLLSNSMKMLKKNGIRAVTTLADQSRHVGSIYQVCNFTYYGLTNPKSDFHTPCGKTNARMKTKDAQGVWVTRTRKHRYAYLLDKNIKCLYDEVTPYPTVSETEIRECCGGTGKVFDNRFDVEYDCPVCNRPEKSSLDEFF